MKKIKVLKLGQVFTDTATGLEGTLTNWYLDMEGRIDYYFQPRGINPETGQPVGRQVLEGHRLTPIADVNYEEIEIKFDILGSQVTDKASGFTGTAVALIRHINGCLHVVVQPKGVLPKTGEAIKRSDFDTRELEGEKIPKLGESALAHSKQTTPSPSGSNPTGNDGYTFSRSIIQDRM